MNIKVKENDTLLNYLYNNLDMPKKKIKQYLQHGSIYVNNVRTTKFDYPLIIGMNIVIDTKSKNSTKLPFEILFEDDNIIVINKPSGLLTIATEKEKDNTLYHIVSNYLKSKNKNNKVFIVHRLDKDTSGIVILAKNETIKNKLQENWNSYVKLREYVAVVHGRLKNKSGRIIENLKETKTGLVYKSHDGKEAITDYEVIKEGNNYSLVSIKIETGKKNQIRVAFSNLGNCIVGDKKYGIKDNENRLYLHANRLKIFYPVIGKDILFETSVPNEFKKIINK